MTAKARGSVECGAWRRPARGRGPGVARAPRPPPPPPNFCKDLPEDNWVEIQDDQFSLHGFGDWCRYTDDSAASDGIAVRMPGSHSQWAVQFLPTDEIPGAGRWQCYVLARCVAKAKKGRAMVIGLYDTSCPECGEKLTLDQLLQRSLLEYGEIHLPPFLVADVT